MYYYIAEPLTTNQERRKIDDIKSLLSQLGIAGEFAIASPARTVEEHLQLAFAKGFTTIVSIGSDALLSRVAATLLDHRYERAVLGAIPLQSGQKLWAMLDCRSLTEVGEALKARRFHPIDVMELGKGQAIVSDGLMHLDKPVRFQLRYRGATLLGQLTDMTITTTGELKLWDRSVPQASWLQRLVRPAADQQQAVTSLLAESWQLATEVPCTVTIGGEMVAQTPIAATRRPKALKFIASRATITTRKDSSQSKEP